MGYTSWFNGTIKLKDGKAINILKYLLKKGVAPFDEVEGLMIITDEGEVDINGEGKYYEEEIEKACYFIKLLDKDAEGEISCEGDDSFDLWKIEINKRGVEILRGEVAYEFEKNYKDENIEEQSNKILKDKQLNKKIILSQLEEK